MDTNTAYIEGFIDAREMTVSYLKGRSNGLRAHGKKEEAAAVDELRDALTIFLALEK